MRRLAGLVAAGVCTAGVMFAVELINVSAASLRGPEVAPGSLAVAFGSNLAATSAAANPTVETSSLAGVSVTVRDSAGAARGARLLFVSPGQVNYVIPEGLAEGPAIVSIAGGPGGAAEGPIEIRKVAPGLFTANADGKGVASATALRIAPDGTRTGMPVSRYDETLRRHLSIPIDMGQTGDQVYLTLYGTGIRNAAAVAVKMADQDAHVTSRGADSTYPGLDQLAVLVPRGLAGQGRVTLQLTADGVAANPVTIAFEENAFLNLDFEVEVRGQPAAWYTGGNGYRVVLDSENVTSGSRSLRIENVSALQADFGVATQEFPITVARGKRIRLSGDIRTQGITYDLAGLWMRVDGPSGILAFDNMSGRGVKGTTGWRRYTIDLPVSEAATQIYFGALHSGNGIAWFDNFSIEIDGVPYVPGPGSVLVGEPSGDQVKWVKDNAIPFATPDAGNGFEDLRALKDVIGSARIVGLGEGTHGTSEHFRMKHRLLEYLATELGFTIFSIEASMPEAYRLNDYVLRGEGNPVELLKGMYFWTWNTQEVLDMIEWMRQFNASGKGRLQFTGFDMQYPQVAIANVRDFVAKADLDYAGTVTAAYDQAMAVYYASSPSATVLDNAAYAARMVREHLEQNRSNYLAGFTAVAIDWAIQNGRIVEQVIGLKTQYRDSEMAAIGYRDSAMAANLDWILAQNPGEKVVAWAHNAHISRAPGVMGGHLADAHGRDYLPLGQLFHQGSYNANPLNEVHEAVPSFPGTIEYVLNSAGIPQFVLDLRRGSPDDPASAWLFGDAIYRSIGAVAVDGFYWITNIARDYDLLVFFDKTAPTRLLPR